MNFLRNNARLFAMLGVVLLTLILGSGFNYDPSQGFLEYLFTNFSFTIGMLLTVVAGFIGERRLIDIEPNTTLTSIVAVLTFLLPIIGPDIDWTSVIGQLNLFASNGQLTWGAILGVLVNFFGDTRIGRPVPEGSAASHTYMVRDLPKIVILGNKRQ